MFNASSSSLAVGLALLLANAADARARPTPKELIVQFVSKKQAEISGLRVHDELNWFGFKLLDKAPSQGSVYRSKGTSTHFLKGSGIWDDVQVESAEGVIVGLTFSKKFSGRETSEPFLASLREHIGKRLGPPAPSEILPRGYYSWSLANETEFLNRWRSYYECKVALAQDPGSPFEAVLCTKEPAQARIVQHLASVGIERPTEYYVALKIGTTERLAAIRRERERKQNDFARQLESEDAGSVATN